MAGNITSKWLGLLLAATLLSGANIAHAQEKPTAVDDEQAPPPLSLEIVYTGDVMGVVDGGVKRGARYLDNLNVTADADLQQLVGWRGATVHVDILNNMGGRPNDLVGSVQGVDNIEVGQRRIKVYEAWIEQQLGAGTSLKLGLYDLNSEFYANDASGMLLAPPFGIGSELASTGTNGPAIFPSTALAARLKAGMGNAYAQFAVINAKAGTLGDDDGVDVSGCEGVLLIGELGWTRDRSKIAAGAWQYTKRQPVVVPPGLTETGARATARGVYLVMEYGLIGANDDPRQVTGFARVGLSDGLTTPFKAGWQAGLLVDHVIASRPASAFSLGVGSSLLSNHYRSGDLALLGAETVIEATYGDELIKGVALQPDVQYIIHTGTDRSLKNAWVLGLRLSIGWSSN